MSCRRRRRAHAGRGTDGCVALHPALFGHKSAVRRVAGGGRTGRRTARTRRRAGAGPGNVRGTGTGIRDFPVRLGFRGRELGEDGSYIPRSRSACTAPPCGARQTASAERAWASGTVASSCAAPGIRWRRDRPFRTAHPRATDPPTQDEGAHHGRIHHRTAAPHQDDRVRPPRGPARTATTSSRTWSRASSTTCPASPPSPAWRSARPAPDQAVRTGPRRSSAGARSLCRSLRPPPDGASRCPSQSCQAPNSSRWRWSGSKTPGVAATVRSPVGRCPGRPPVSAPASRAIRSPAARSQGCSPRS
ncbi:hypothetical protein SGRIM128S_07116 [Streptomyces griseomycini]